MAADMAGFEHVVVVGGSLAGLRSAESLRQHGFDGRITMVSAEARMPYDRPPLSKQILAGAWEPELATLLPEGDRTDAEWRLGRRAVSLDGVTRRVRLDDGEVLTYDGLIIATGATPRSLPGAADLAGVHLLRSLDDCLALCADLDGGPRVVVIGAGFIGAEVAATCRGRGLDVTVVEALPVPLERGLGARMGTVCANLHRDHGVDLRLATGVSGFVAGTGGRVAALDLSDGSRIDADVVVVGIGVAPATSWLEGSGLTLADGVLCDEHLATTLPGVVAAGDVARWPHPRFGVEMRLEHWTNAVEQGTAAAKTLLGRPEPFAPVPYFWSDQYDRKLQFVGIAGPDDRVEVVHGTSDEYQFVALYERDGKLTGALGMNRPRLLMPYRRLIDQGATFDAALAHAATQG